MLARNPWDDTRSLFEDALLSALTEGHLPNRTRDLSAATWSAIEAIAREHPEATARLISDAFDTFERESGFAWLDRRSTPPVESGSSRRNGPKRRPRPSRQRG